MPDNRFGEFTEFTIRLPRRARSPEGRVSAASRVN
jgi:hypothetical protein